MRPLNQHPKKIRLFRRDLDIKKWEHTRYERDLYVGSHPHFNTNQDINPEDGDCTARQNVTLFGKHAQSHNYSLHIQTALDPLHTLSSTVKGPTGDNDLSPSSANAI